MASGAPRAIVVLFSVLLLLAGFFMAWTHVVEPIGQSELTDCTDKYADHCKQTEDDIFRIGGQYAPLVLFGGFIVWAIAWVVRRTRTTQQGPGGFR